jgi:hypothetical protein
MRHHSRTCTERKEFLEAEHQAVLGISQAAGTSDGLPLAALKAFRQQQERRWQHEESCPQCKGGLAA